MAGFGGTRRPALEFAETKLTGRLWGRTARRRRCPGGCMPHRPRPTAPPEPAAFARPRPFARAVAFASRHTPMPRRLKHETRVLLYAALGPAPAVVVALILLWAGPYSTKVQWTLTVLVLGVWAAATAALHDRVVFPL